MGSLHADNSGVFGGLEASSLVAGCIAISSFVPIYDLAMNRSIALIRKMLINLAYSFGGLEASLVAGLPHNVSCRDRDRRPWPPTLRQPPVNPYPPTNTLETI